MDTKSGSVNAKHIQNLQVFDIGLNTFTASRASRWFVRAGTGESLLTVSVQRMVAEKNPMTVVERWRCVPASKPSTVDNE